MKSKLKIGPQAALDYKRQIMPNFEGKKELHNVVEVKNSSFFGPISSNIWMEDFRASAKNKTVCLQNRERSIEAEKIRREKEANDVKELQEQKANRIHKNKYESKQREQQRIFELALVQQQSSQELDTRQIEQLIHHQACTPFQVQQQLIRSPGRSYLPGSAENKWNKLSETAEKNQKFIFTPKVLQLEKSAISTISNRIVEKEKEQEEIKQCFKKQYEELHKSFLDKRIKNLQKEKDLKLGVFGKQCFDKEQGKVVRMANTPELFEQQFPLKYQSQPYLSKLKAKPMSEKEMQLFERLSSPKKSYEAENIFDHGDFSGMLSPQIDKIMCLKQQQIVEPFKQQQYNHVEKILCDVQDPNKIAHSILQRPQTSNSHSSKIIGFKMEPLSSFDELQAQRSRKYIYIEQTSEQMVAEMDEFAAKLKKERLTEQSRPQTGFCRVSKKEHELLRNIDGYKQVRELKKNDIYPRNLIKGCDE